MTWWATETVRGFAQQAGFAGGDLEVIVAVALASSGGQDAALQAIDTTPPGQLVGLFAVPNWLVPAGEVVDLWDPRANAAVAYRLYLAAGRAFTWSPVWRGGAWRLVDPGASQGPMSASGKQFGSAMPAGPALGDAVGGARSAARQAVDTMMGISGALGTLP